MRKRKRIKNKILRTLVGLNVVSMLIFGMALDSPSYIPMIVVAINVLYLFIFMLANAPRG